MVPATRSGEVSPLPSQRRAHGQAMSVLLEQRRKLAPCRTATRAPARVRPRPRTPDEDLRVGVLREIGSATGSGQRLGLDMAGQCSDRLPPRSRHKVGSEHGHRRANSPDQHVKVRSAFRLRIAGTGDHHVAPGTRREGSAEAFRVSACTVQRHGSAIGQGRPKLPPREPLNKPGPRAPQRVHDGMSSNSPSPIGGASSAVDRTSRASRHRRSSSSG